MISKCSTTPALASFNLAHFSFTGSKDIPDRKWTISSYSGRSFALQRGLQQTRFLRCFLHAGAHLFGLKAEPKTLGAAQKGSKLQFAQTMASTPSNQDAIEVINKDQEKLVGVLEGDAEGEVVILCHGFLSSKQSSTIQAIVPGLLSAGFGVLLFDFSGNGESGGNFKFGNYGKEVEDLRSMVEYVRKVKRRTVRAVVGHSKGGDVVILYAAKYGDVSLVVNVSGRFDLSWGLQERLGKAGLSDIREKGFFDVKDSQGAVKYRVTKECLDERLATNVEAAARSIDKTVRVLTVHGTADETIPVQDGKLFDSVISNHKLVLVEGADHRYSKHREELNKVVSNFISSRPQNERLLDNSTAG